MTGIENCKHSKYIIKLYLPKKKILFMQASDNLNVLKPNKPKW